jgi:hypothetical protein
MEDVADAVLFRDTLSTIQTTGEMIEFLRKKIREQQGRTPTLANLDRLAVEDTKKRVGEAARALVETARNWGW